MNSNDSLIDALKKALRKKREHNDLETQLRQATASKPIALNNDTALAKKFGADTLNGRPLTK